MRIQLSEVCGLKHIRPGGVIYFIKTNETFYFDEDTFLVIQIFNRDIIDLEKIKLDGYEKEELKEFFQGLLDSGIYSEVR